MRDEGSKVLYGCKMPSPLQHEIKTNLWHITSVLTSHNNIKYSFKV